MGRPKIHISAFERIANGTDGYAPGNIPDDCEVVTTKRLPPQPPWPADKTLDAIGELLRRGAPHANRGSPLEENAETVRRGRMSYHAFVAVSVLALGTLTDAARYRDWVLAAVVLIAFGLAGWLIRCWATRVDDRLHTAYAKRWNKHRAALRKLLRTDAEAHSRSSDGRASRFTGGGNGTESRPKPAMFSDAGRGAPPEA
jgi:hypothetical protein